MLYMRTNSYHGTNLTSIFTTLNKSYNKQKSKSINYHK